jgi:apolipoprotein N-acyltransferase
MLVAACAARALPAAIGASEADRPRRAVWPLLPATLALAGAIGYGEYELRAPSRSPAPREPLRVALIQGSFDTIFEFNAERDRSIFLRYRQLSEQAVAQYPDVQLVVWPESMFTGDLGEILLAGPIDVPADVPLPAEEYRQRVRTRALTFSYKVDDVARRLNATRNSGGKANPGGVHLIVGTDTLQLGATQTRRYNSALCISPEGQLTGRYYKMHRVMFGEYLPWGDVFPWVYRITPMTQGLDAGQGAACFPVEGWNLSPSICFESTVPHLIRRQVETLRKSNRSPDLLVNVTNDGWFWGSSILDLQLACSVFRAIENRLPVIVAANTGISASVDSRGRVQQQGPRRDEAVLYAEVEVDGRLSCYRRMGDLPAGLCALFCLAAALFGLGTRLRRNKAGRRGRY